MLSNHPNHPNSSDISNHQVYQIEQNHLRNPYFPVFSNFGIQLNNIDQSYNNVYRKGKKVQSKLSNKFD